MTGICTVFRTLFLIGMMLAPGWARAAYELIVPHLPRDTKHFSVSIVVDNFLNQERRLRFVTYDENGLSLDGFSEAIAPLTRKTFDPDELFKGLPVSYFKVIGDRLEDRPLGSDTMTGLLVGVAYSFTANPNSTTFVEAISKPAKRWRVHTGDWQETFDGLAIVNFDDCAGTGAQINHYGPDGQLLQVLDLNPTRGRFSKAVINLGTVFDAVPGSYMDIVSGVNLAVTALRGSLALGKEDSFFVGNIAFPLDPFEEERRALEENRSKWNKAGISAYAFQFQRICFCLDELTRKVTLIVNNNWIQSYRYTSDDTEVDTPYKQYFLSIDQLFTLIEDAMARGVFTLDVSYDPDLGFPTSISIDEIPCAVDDEFAITAAGLQPIKE